MRVTTMSRLDVVLLLLLVVLIDSQLPTSRADTNITTHPTAFLSPTPDAEPNYPPFTTFDFDLVPDPAIVLNYHMGPVMTGRKDVIKLFVIYYGSFSDKQKSTLQLFFQSLGPGVKPHGQQLPSFPTVYKWWKITREYVDLYNTGVAREIALAGEQTVSSSKNLTQLDIQQLVKDSSKKFGTDARHMYLVLTAEDVFVERFCMNVCGTHFYTFPSDETESQMLPYGWVGNPAKQCPSLCSWPYAPGGVLNTSLIPPNGEASIDGMVITLGSIIASMATNPFGNGYFQADGAEAVGVCQGKYGPGAFPGYPGKLLVDNATGASFNVYGENNAKFLLPWAWRPSTLQCAGQA